MGNNALLVLDIALASMNVAVRANELLNRAAMEGRDVGADELMRLTQETSALQAKWKEAIGK